MIVFMSSVGIRPNSITAKPMIYTTNNISPITTTTPTVTTHNFLCCRIIGISCFLAWICSCHNLSSLYEEMSNIDLALRFVMAPHEYLLEVSNSSVDNEDVKLIAFKGLSLTLPAVMSFAQKYPICEDCLQKFTSLQQLMDHEEKSIH